MPIRLVVALLVLVALACPARAEREQDSDSICSFPRWVSTGEGRGDANRTATAMAVWINRQSIHEGLRIERKKRQVSDAEAVIQLNLRRPDAVTERAWAGAFFIAIAYPGLARSLPPKDGANVLTAHVEPPVPQGRDSLILVAFRPPETGWRSAWQVAIAACIPPESVTTPTLAAEATQPTQMPAIFGLTQVTISSYYLSVVVGVGSVLSLYLLLVFAAAKVHAQQLRMPAADAEAGHLPPWVGAINPMVISQDAFGAASLARFQVLLFTLVVVGVYAYVLIRTGELSSLSTDVLWLLGITLVGSTLAGIAGRPVLATGNRLWLLATGVLDNQPRQPGWQDLLGSDGEIDVTRVQALAFSIFAAAALVANGPNDLENFVVPDTLKYLIGLSQAVYVAGKALPREAATRLNEEVRTIRDAEAAVLIAPGDPAALVAFETARNSIGKSLLDVFGECFRAQRLAELRPGRRLRALPVPDTEPVVQSVIV